MSEQTEMRIKMKTLVLAEKPSVGRDIGRVLHCTPQGNGFLEGKDYIVTWGLGHLVTLKDPEGYDKKYNRRAMMLVITVFFALPVILTVLIDLRINQAITWSGYVFGGAVVFYTALILPWWFSHPNPVIFTPCTFASVILYLWYIEYMTDGKWFLTFAFPVTAIAGVIVTAVITLTKYTGMTPLSLFPF